MGTILSDTSERAPHGASETETVDEYISDSNPTKTKAVPSQHKAQPNQSDTTDIDEFVSQFGSYFSVTPSSECGAKSINSSSSSHYSSTCTHSIKLFPINTPQKSSINYNDNACKPSTRQPPSLSGSDTAYTVSSDRCSILSPMSPCSPSSHRKSSTHHNDHEFKLAAFGVRCQCQVASCKAIKRIIKMLKWYSMAVRGDNNYEMLIQKVMESQYDKYLLDDYQHIVNDHLLQLECIRKEINKQIEPCNVCACAAYQRYEELVTKDLSQCDDATFCLHFMELIHCYIVHSKL